MAEVNGIYDTNKQIVGVFRFGVAWTRDPRVRLGEYDYGDGGMIYNNDGNQVAKFEESRVTANDGSYVGHYVEVPLAEMSNKESPTLPDSLVKRLQINDRVVGWCIGNPGSACAAIYFLFASNRHA